MAYKIRYKDSLANAWTEVDVPVTSAQYVAGNRVLRIPVYREVVANAERCEIPFNLHWDDNPKHCAHERPERGVSVLRWGWFGAESSEWSSLFTYDYEQRYALGKVAMVQVLDDQTRNGMWWNTGFETWMSVRAHVLTYNFATLLRGVVFEVIQPTNALPDFEWSTKR